MITEKFCMDVQMRVNKNLTDFIIMETNSYLNEVTYTINPKMIADAIEKQIPKKPRKIKVEYANSDRIWYPTFCPRCFEDVNIGLWDSLIDKGRAYCYRCGQAIDWSEENEDYIY